MTKKQLKISVNQLIIDGSRFDLRMFDSLKDEDFEKHDTTHRDDHVVETLSVKKVYKHYIEDRFVCLYIIQGSKYPYPEKVINNDLEEVQNPRDPNQIEMTDQFFVLMDTQTQRIYLSDLRKKYVISLWLEDRLGKSIVIKSIIEENEFINKIKTVNQISFTVEPNLFNGSGGELLTKALIDDIYGYGADKAKLELQYNNTRISDNIKQKFNDLIGKKDNFQTITVIGTSDENFESVFNLDEIVNKFDIEVDVKDDSQLIDPESVFNALIGVIK